MPCNQWNELWVAKLYDELEPSESRELELHLESCSDCRSTLEELEQSRQSLHASSPRVPASPRVIVLRARRPAFWTYASGIAAALLVFVLGGWIASTQLPPGADRSAEVEALLASNAQNREALEHRIGELEAALTEMTGDRNKTLPGATQAMVSREEYEMGLDDLQQQMRYERARDVEFLVGEMNAVELRAARWVDETREGLQMVAMHSNLSQR